MTTRRAIESLTVSIPPELLDAIAQRTAEIMSDHAGNTQSPWMSRKRAAEYLDLPLSRLEKDRTLPSHRQGGRVMYHRGELDEYLLGLEAAA
jgi:hypothetical protein